MGYDPRAVKISKTVKRMAMNILDAHRRGQFIRDFVKIEQSQALEAKTRNRRRDKDSEQQTPVSG